jgi:Ca-activated chloride channel family protein
VENLSKIRGANYYTIHNPVESKKRLADEFDFMVTPLVFDLELSLQSCDFTIEGVYGSPDADLADGKVMYVNTLFPSAAEDEENRSRPHSHFREPQFQGSKWQTTQSDGKGEL